MCAEARPETCYRTHLIGRSLIAAGIPGVTTGTNIERALVDVTRNNRTDLKMIDFKLSRPDLFEGWAGPIGALFGTEYRVETFVDDRDPRLDGTITYTDIDGDTFPYISDVMNSSPSSDSKGRRRTFSLFGELAIPVFENFDLQAAVRYEDASDYGDTTVGKLAFGWNVLDSLLLRGSWSEAFRAPNLITVNESLVVRNNTNDDWLCQYAQDFSSLPEAQDLDCSYSMQRRARGSADLEPEKSENQSIGIVLNPIDNLTFTIDFWKIEKEDTIGLFGEENHTLLDLLYYLEAGNSNCATVGNPAVGRVDPDDDEIAIFESIGLCPAGRADFIEDNYANLDTRIVEGYDFGVYDNLPSAFGDWDFTWQGSITTRYDQVPGHAAQALRAERAVAEAPLAFGQDLLVVDDGVDRVRRRRRHRQADLPHVASRQAHRDLTPCGAGIGGLVDARLGAAVNERPLMAPALVGRGIQHVGIARIHVHLVDAGLVRHME